ncbi:MAG: lytic transglycosylase domain-containing protein [Pseudomonadota bacterium]
MSVYFDNDWPPGSGPYRELIWDAAGKHGVPVMLLAWLLWKESAFRDDIISGRTKSRVGALGIAQFMPETAREVLGSEDLALVPSEAIAGAARYLARLYRGTGNWPDALAAYNWGIGNVQRRGLQYAPRETVDYVNTIVRRSGYTQRV